MWHNAGIRSGVYMTGCPCPRDRPPVPQEWLSRARRGRRRGRPQRAGGGDRAGPGRPLGAGARGAPEIGGGTRTEELTLPGFRHDVCSAIHPLALGSPFLRAGAGGARRASTSSPRSPRPTRSTAAPPSCCTARSTTRPPALGADAAAYAALIGPVVRDCGRARRRPARPACGCRDTRSRPDASASRRSARRRGSRGRGSPASRRGRCARVTRRTRCSRSSGGDGGVRAGAADARARGRLAGRGGRLAGDHRCDGLAVSARSAARSRPARRSTSLADVAGAGRCCST